MSPPKQTGTSKPEKTRAQKDAHNASCRKSRQKIKRMREEFEKKYNEMETNCQQMQDEMKRMKLELNQKNSQIRSMQEENLRLKQKQKEEIEWMKYIPDQWKLKEGCYSSMAECQEWVLSQTYDQVGEGSGSGPDFTSLNGSASLLNNQDLFSASLLYNQDLFSASLLNNQDLFSASLLYNQDLSASALSNVSIPDNGLFTGQKLFDARYDDNCPTFTNDHATGFPAASTSAFPDCSDHFTHHDPAVKHDEDFCSENNPSTKRD